MAWKVIGQMPGWDKSGKMPAIYGPLPVKVWVKVAGEKKHRVSKAKASTSRGIFDKTDQGRKAVEYARWLATRDGIVLPEGGGGTPRFEPVMVPGRKSPELRVSAVVFSHPYKQERRGPLPRGYYARPEPTLAPVTIQIPNWDFVPREPVETVDPLPARNEMFFVVGNNFQMVA